MKNTSVSHTATLDGMLLRYHDNTFTVVYFDSILLPEKLTKSVSILIWNWLPIWELSDASWKFLGMKSIGNEYHTQEREVKKSIVEF